MLREGGIAVKVSVLPLSADYADYADSEGASIRPNAAACFLVYFFNLRNLRNLRIGFAVSDFPVIVSG